jgi:3-oxoacyl-[acyl-carrier protein] reductase
LSLILLAGAPISFVAPLFSFPARNSYFFTFHVARAALPVLRRRGRGAIVNVASLLGKQGLGDYVTYCATKFGVIGLTEALADEVRGTGIKVWAVCPGQVDTDMARQTGITERERQDLIRPERVARVVVALATGRRRTESGAAVDVTR